MVLQGGDKGHEGDESNDREKYEDKAAEAITHIHTHPHKHTRNTNLIQITWVHYKHIKLTK